MANTSSWPGSKVFSQGKVLMETLRSAVLLVPPLNIVLGSANDITPLELPCPSLLFGLNVPLRILECFSVQIAYSML